MWVYGGKVHRMPDPRVTEGDRGQYVDADGDGLLDAIITGVELKLLDVAGQPRDRLMPGEVGVFVVQPEYGADEADEFDLQITVTGPAGPAPIVLDEAVQKAKTVGDAPSPLAARWRVSTDLAPDKAGQYTFAAKLTIGKVAEPLRPIQPVRFTVYARGQRPPKSKLVGTVVGGLRHLGREVGKFGTRLWRNVVPGKHADREPASLVVQRGHRAEETARALLSAEGAPWSAHTEDYSSDYAAEIRNAIRPPNGLVAIPRRELQADPAAFGDVPTFWLGWLACRDVGVALGNASLADADWTAVEVGEATYQCVPVAAEFPPDDPFTVHLLVPHRDGDDLLRAPGIFALQIDRARDGRAGLTVVDRAADSYEVVANLKFQFSRDDKRIEISGPLVVDLLEPETAAAETTGTP